MAQYSIDITFAYAQLGLKPGASLEAIQAVLTHAVGYRFTTRERIDNLRRIVDFFVARRQFGDATQSYTEIKKFYHRKAMDLHPDRNKGSDATEEKLKKVNASYRLVTEIYREAKEYYKQSEAYREEIEEEARQITKREAGDSEEILSATPQQEAEKPQPRTKGTTKYMAASVPRFIRQSRLGYLPAKCIIGSRLSKGAGGANLYYDIVMLPEPDFVRMKSNVGLQHVIAPAPKMGETFNPVFVLADTKHVIVPAAEANAEEFAQKYFKKAFGLTDVS